MATGRPRREDSTRPPVLWREASGFDRGAGAAHGQVSGARLAIRHTDALIDRADPFVAVLVPHEEEVHFVGVEQRFEMLPHAERDVVVALFLELRRVPARRSR